MMRLAAAGKGFGKNVEPETPSAAPVTTAEKPVDTRTSSNSDEPIPQFLTSIDTSEKKLKDIEFDENMTPDERQEKILREQFGLKRPGETKDGTQKGAERNEDKDIFQLLPRGVLIAFDQFLKAGLSLSTLAFVGAGVAITLEAWANASGDSSFLPDDLDQFVVNVIEPNFTPGLLVLLGFSITLGVFTIASGGSEGSQYKE